MLCLNSGSLVTLISNVSSNSIVTLTQPRESSLPLVGQCRVPSCAGPLHRFRKGFCGVSLPISASKSIVTGPSSSGFSILAPSILIFRLAVGAKSYVVLKVPIWAPAGTRRVKRKGMVGSGYTTTGRLHCTRQRCRRVETECVV